jgi:hypothetical protein
MKPHPPVSKSFIRPTSGSLTLHPAPPHGAERLKILHGPVNWE